MNFYQYIFINIQITRSNGGFLFENSVKPKYHLLNTKGNNLVHSLVRSYKKGMKVKLLNESIMNGSPGVLHRY